MRSSLTRTGFIVVGDKRTPVKNIIAKYNKGLGSFSIAKQLGCSKYFILKILRKSKVERRHGVEAHRKRRAYKINFDFFKEIRTETQAYFLGLFCSDGCNHVKDNVAEITLNVNDKLILETLSKFIFVNKRPLIKIKPKTYDNKKGRVFHVKEGRRLSICSKEVCDLLLKLGIGERKTWSLKFPGIPDNLIKHFVRGYFDGDGGLSITRVKNRFVASFCIIGTEDICVGIQRVLSSVGISAGIWHRKKDPKEVFVLGCSGCRKIIKIMDFLYDGHTISIERKFLLYRKLRKLRSFKYMYDLYRITDPFGRKFTRFNVSSFARKKGLKPTKVLFCARENMEYNGWHFEKLANKILVSETGLVDATPRKLKT
jgi:hypothetical protein